MTEMTNEQSLAYEILSKSGMTGISWADIDAEVERIRAKRAQTQVSTRHVQDVANAMARSTAAQAGSGAGTRRARSQAIAIASATAALAGVNLGVRAPRVCTHLFGLAGGFSRCSVCGRGAVKGEVCRG